MMPGMPEKRTHDYVRHGTVDLFAAFDIATGVVIAKTYKSHRAKEWIKFLEEIDKHVPQLAEPDEPDGELHMLEIHIIADNYATHKTPAVQQWLANHPRFHVHFTPTSSSWLNQVERWFGLLTEKLLRRGVHKSVRQLEKTSLPGWTHGMRTLNRSSGRNQQKKYSNHSGDFSGGSKIQDTSGVSACDGDSRARVRCGVGADTRPGRRPRARHPRGR